MHACEDCGRDDFRSARGLAQHRRRKHPSDGSGENARAAEATLAELDRMGRLEDVDAARVQAIKSMARALDDNPFNSQMWREYREALEALSRDDSDNDGALEAILEELRS